jgi:hypothetical protein
VSILPLEFRNMNINELYKHINNRREQSGLPQLSDLEYLAKISEMQVKGIIKIANGEVKPVEEKR